MQPRPFPTLELVGLMVMLAISALLFFRARRSGSLVLPALSGSFNLLTSLIVATFITAHLVAVSKNALANRGHGGAETFVYDFRFYSLMLVGAVILIPALISLWHSWRLALGTPGSWKAAFSSMIVLIAINAPLAPLQEFALGFSIFVALNLILLLLSRRLMAHGTST